MIIIFNGKFTKCMSRNRFEGFLKYMHLVANRNVSTDKLNPNYNKLAKTESSIKEHNNL